MPDFHMEVSILEKNEHSMNRSKYSQASGKIVFGKKVGVQGGFPDSMPWDVALVMIDRKSTLRNNFCGGCLLSNEYVLTAAHCDQAFKEKFEYRLLIGSTQKKDMLDE